MWPYENGGPFGNGGFPYSNFHSLNLDWIIGIVKRFEDNYSNIDTSLQNAISSIDEDAANSLESISNAELHALQRIDNAIAAYSRRYILIGDSYGNRTTADDNTYYDILKSTLQIPDSDIFFKAAAGAAFGHQSGVSFLEVLQSMTITDPDTITDIFIQCGANDLAYTTEQEVTGMNDFMDYVKNHFPKARCSIFACGLIMDQENMQTRRLETLATFRNMSSRGFKFILNSDTVLMNTVLLESDRCHPNQYGVQYIAWQLASAFTAGYCDNAYRLYQEQLNTTVTMEGLAEGTQVGYSETQIMLANHNNITEIFPSGGRVTVGLNLNNVTITPSNYINIIMDNCLGIPPEGEQIPVTIARATDGLNIPGYMSYKETANNKYQLQVRPLYDLALGSSNSYFHIFFNTNFING